MYMTKLSDLPLEVKAAIFGKPLVQNIDQIKTSVSEGFGSSPKAPYNEFSNASTLSDANNHFVSVNNDTLYSQVMMDLSAGPVVLEIPEIKNRYYVFQLVDAWTNNFGYLGQRTLGEKGGKFIFAQSDQMNDIPAEYSDYQVIKAPSQVIAVVGRIACTGEDDLVNVHALQKQLVVHGVNEKAEITGTPTVDTNDTDALLFWKKLRTYMQAYPVSESFKPIFEDIEKLIGLNYERNANDYFAALSEEAQQKLIDGEKQATKVIVDLLENSNARTENGWQEQFHVFDYNVDYFEFGALKGKKWEVGYAKTTEALEEASVLRNVAATAGLWGNNGYEALYFPTYVDGPGNQLDGNNVYELTFTELPPVDAFWSITMYDAENFFLVDNEINRYSIGDRTAGIKYEDDGSLKIQISAEKPEDTANWLPAPKGRFRPVLRAYLPQEAIFNETYKLPGINLK